MAKKTLLEKLRAIRNLESAWQTIQENGRSSKSDKVKLELEEFAADAQNRLRSLQSKLARNTFTFPPATAVPIPKDKPPKDGGRQKIRPIVLAPVESRIVQRALLNVLLDIDGLKPYVKTEFSFGGIRGNRPRQATERPKDFPCVDGAMFDSRLHGAFFLFLSPKKSQPFQRVLVMVKAISERLVNIFP